jgi:hypothetical protein
LPREPQGDAPFFDGNAPGAAGITLDDEARAAHFELTVR